MVCGRSVFRAVGVGVGEVIRRVFGGVVFTCWAEIISICMLERGDEYLVDVFFMGCVVVAVVSVCVSGSLPGRCVWVSVFGCRDVVGGIPRWVCVLWWYLLRLG